MKIGIGRPQQQTVIDYVLEPFPAAEEEELSAILHKAAAAVQLFVREGIEAAMNTFNSQTAK